MYISTKLLWEYYKNLMKNAKWEPHNLLDFIFILMRLIFAKIKNNDKNWFHLFIVVNISMITHYNYLMDFRENVI